MTAKVDVILFGILRMSYLVHCIQIHKIGDWYCSIDGDSEYM